MECLVASMSAAIHHVAHVTLNIQSVPCINQPGGTIISPSDLDLITAFNTVFVTSASRGVCELLAPDVPHLRHLQLKGLLDSSAFRVFGALCRHITTLEIKVCTVQAETMCGMDLALPNLSYLILRSPVAGTPHEDIQEYMDTVLPNLKRCSKLKVLELRLAPAATAEGKLAAGSAAALATATPAAATAAEAADTTAADAAVGRSALVDDNAFTLKCTPEVWNCLPQCLHELRCDVELSSLLAATEFISNIQVLTLKEFPAMDLLQLLDYAPLLKRMTVTAALAQEVDIIRDHEEDSSEELESLKERLHSSFKLSCPSVFISGNTESIIQLNTWLSPMQDTTFCTLGFKEGLSSELCLKGLGRAFPAMTCLSLSINRDDGTGVLLLQEQDLVSLEGCRHLHQLEVSFQMVFTHSGLVNLSKRVPFLHILICMPCEGVGYTSAMNEIDGNGGHLLITERDI